MENAFAELPTQLGCPEEHDSPSQYDKIVDYQIGFGNDASYRKLKDLDKTNVIPFNQDERES